MNRWEIISQNRSNRLRGLPLLEVPPKPPVKYGWQVYKDGDYLYFTDVEADAIDLKANGHKLKKIRALR